MCVYAVCLTFIANEPPLCVMSAVDSSRPKRPNTCRRVTDDNDARKNRAAERGALGGCMENNAANQ